MSEYQADIDGLDELQLQQLNSTCFSDYKVIQGFSP